MKAIIIDDEQSSHDVLNTIIPKYHTGLEIKGSAFDLKHGKELIERFHPELIFLDIKLPDGLGFDLLRELDKIDFQVIFITAYDQYAYTAIKFGALDYITKPIDINELGVAIQKAQNRNERSISEKQLAVLWNTIQNLREKKVPTTIGISTLDGIYYKLVEDIIRLEAQQNYTDFVFNNDKRRLLASVNLGEYESQFKLYDQFMRVHRSHLVNLRYVDRYVKSDGGYLVMKNGDQLSVSRMYRDDLIGNMEKI